MSNGKQLAREIAGYLNNARRSQAIRMHQRTKVDVSMHDTAMDVFISSAISNDLGLQEADVDYPYNAQEAVNMPMDSLLVSPFDIPIFSLGSRTVDLAI